MTEHNHDQIKNGKTVETLFTYELRGDGNVDFNVHKYMDQKKVDSKTFKLSTLKTESFSEKEESKKEFEKKEKEYEEEYKKERDKEKEKEKQKEDDSALNEV